MLALETTVEQATSASSPSRVPRSFTPTTRRRPAASFSTWTFSTSTLRRMSTPLAFISAVMRLIMVSVPPWKMNTPFDMKFEKTMPKVIAGSSRVEPLA